MLCWIRFAGKGKNVELQQISIQKNYLWVWKCKNLLYILYITVCSSELLKQLNLLWFFQFYQFSFFREDSPYIVRDLSKSKPSVIVCYVIFIPQIISNSQFYYSQRLEKLDWPTSHDHNTEEGRKAFAAALTKKLNRLSAQRKRNDVMNQQLRNIEVILTVKRRGLFRTCIFARSSCNCLLQFLKISVVHVVIFLWPSKYLIERL